MEVDTQVLEEAKPGAPNGSALPADTTDADTDDQSSATNGHDAVTEPAVKTVPYETEAKARADGWAPKDKWHGDPDKWIDADEFVRRGEQVLPFVKKKLKATEQIAEDLKAEMARERADNAERFKRLEKMNTLALKNQREQIYSQFEADKLKAVAEGDTAEYKRIAQEQARAWHEARVEEPEPVAQEEPKPNGNGRDLRPADKVIVQDFIERNTWFNRDKVLTVAAEEEHKRLLNESPGMSLEDNLAETERLVREQFPKKFGIKPKPATAQPHSPPVEGGGRAPNGGSREKGWSDIPADDRKIAERTQLQYFLPRGVDMETAKDADFKKARDDYARAYHEQG